LFIQGAWNLVAHGSASRMGLSHSFDSRETLIALLMEGK